MSMTLWEIHICLELDFIYCSVIEDHFPCQHLPHTYHQHMHTSYTYHLQSCCQIFLQRGSSKKNAVLLVMFKASVAGSYL